MNGRMRGLVPAVVLVGLAVGPAAADVQTLLGVKFDVRDARPGDPLYRSINVFAQEEPISPNTLVGDPVANGATLRIVARGATSVYDQTFDLPAAGWKTFLTRHDWPVFKVFAYSNLETGGPVRSVIVQRGGYASPEGIPPPVEPRPSEFMIRVRLYGRDGAFDVLPPNLGTEGGVILTLGGGDTYCLGFGASAGGRIVANTARRFTIMRPQGEGCPGEAPADRPPVP
jgi:hypothetical protein